MSHSATGWAFRQKLPGLQKLVLLCLADRHNELTGRCDPSLATIARDAGISRRSVIRFLSALETTGLIVIENRGLTSNAFRLLTSDTQTPPSDCVSPPQCQAVTTLVPHSHRGSDCVAPKPGIEPGSESGKEPKTKSKRSKSAFALPEWIASEVWAAYEEMRCKKRAPMTDHARELVVKRLAGFAAKGHDPTGILENSIVGGWTNVYELKGGNNGNSTGGTTSRVATTKADATRDNAEAAFAELTRGTGKVG